MNLRTVIHLISILTIFLGLAMFASIPAGILMNDPSRPLHEMAFCGTLTTLLGLICMILTRSKPGHLLKSGMREGFATVGFGWLICMVIGALPFIAVGKFRLEDAVFETASGFSTTGASVIDANLILFNGKKLIGGLEKLPCCLLFWRSLIVWMGGMGIVVFALVILPFLGIGGTNQLYNAEVPGLKTNSDQFTPRIAASAKIIWLVYMILTVAEIAFLLLGGMHWFDAVCHSFSTVATGGFSTKASSIAGFSPYIQWVITVFMFLAGCNFALSIRVVLFKRWLIYFQDEEFKFFFSVVLVSILISIGFLMWNHNIPSFGEAVRHSAFQVVSIITTTGFTTADYLTWPSGICAILFLLMFVGGCAGSTSGGMKCVRVLLLVKHAISEIRRCIFPRAIQDIRLNGERMTSSTISKTLAFFFLYIILFFLTAFLLTILCSDMDLLTAVSASISSISNIGPGFGKIGPAYTFGWMNPAAKYLLAFAMVVGRLELYTLLVILLPSFWKR